MSMPDDAGAVRKAGNRLGNPFETPFILPTEVTAMADMLDRYADLLEEIAGGAARPELPREYPDNQGLTL